MRLLTCSIKGRDIQSQEAHKIAIMQKRESRKHYCSGGCVPEPTQTEILTFPWPSCCVDIAYLLSFGPRPLPIQRFLQSQPRLHYHSATAAEPLLLAAAAALLAGRGCWAFSAFCDVLQ